MDKPEFQLLADLILDVKKDVSIIKSDVAANTITLNEHARRSEASENRLDVQEEKLEQFIKEMKPVQEHVQTVSALTKVIGKALKFLALIVSIVSTVLGILKLR
jgi:hypothetical protein